MVLLLAAIMLFTDVLFLFTLQTLTIATIGHAHMSSHVLPSFFSEASTCLGPADTFSLGESPGKGLGLFAMPSLEAGDIIMREAPAIKITPPKFNTGVGYSLAEIGKLLRNELNALPEHAQAEILSLSAYTNEIERKKLDPIVPVFRSNAYNTGNKISLFPKVARINHSCRPNSSYFWNERTGKKVIYATRRIEAGEELFVSYIPLLHVHEDRQKQLDQYGFNCTCDVCVQDKAAMQISDKRRSDIRQFLVDFEHQLTLSIPKSESAKNAARRDANSSAELVKLIEEEELADYYAQVYKIAAVTHARVEEWKPATLWAHKSYQLRTVADAQSQDALEMQMLTSRFNASWNRAM